MRILVNTDKVFIENDTRVESGEYNVTPCEFEFSEEYEGLVKKAVFTDKMDRSYKVDIDYTNNCIIPIEALENKGIVKVGVYAYELEGENFENLKLRYSPTPTVFYVNEGSYVENAENSGHPTPTEIEQLTARVERAEEKASEVEQVEDDVATNTMDIANLKTNVATNTEDIEILNDNVSDLAQGISDLEGDVSNLDSKIGIEAQSAKDYTDTEIGKLDTVASTGDYNDLKNKPSIPTKTSDITNDSGFIDKNVNNLTNYTLKTSTGSLIDLEINQSTYVVTLSLKDIDGNVISSDTIDLPLESVVISGRFDNINKKIVLTLENGNTIDIPVGDLVAGLQTEITSQNKLASDLIDDTNSGNKFTNASEKNTWNEKYDKPVGGIPKTDLASDVQTSLGKADTAIQEADLTDYVKNTDYATSQKGGVFKTSSSYNTAMSNGVLYALNNDYATYQNKENGAIISKGTLENVIAGKELINQTQLDESQATQDEDIATLQEELAKAQEKIADYETEFDKNTAEGESITVTDSMQNNAELDFIGQVTQQQLEGYNLLANEVTSQTINGLNIVKQSDGGLKITGTSTAQVVVPFELSGERTLVAGTYQFRELNATNIRHQVWTNEGIWLSTASANSKTILANTTYSNFRSQIVIDSGVTLNTVYYAWMYLGTDEKTYEPYCGGQPSPNPSYKEEMKEVSGKQVVKVDNGGYRIPKEYQEVEYIENTGTQYIDTGITPKANLSCKVDFAFSNAKNVDQDTVILGTRKDSNNTRFYLLGSSMNGIYMAKGTYYASNVERIKVSQNNIYNIYSKITDDNIYMTANGIVLYDSANGDTIDSTNNMFLFANNSGGIATNIGFNVVIYSCKIFDNDTLVRDYIPCYRKTDNVIGMYDLVSNTFFTNSGTGTFLKGNDVEYEDRPREEQTFDLDLKSKNRLNYANTQNSWDGATVKCFNSNMVEYIPNTNGTIGITYSSAVQNISLPAGMTIIFSRFFENGYVWDSGNFYTNLTLYYSDDTTEIIHIPYANKNNFENVASIIKTLEKDVIKIQHTGSAYAINGLTSPIVFKLQLEEGATATDYEPYYDIKMRGLNGIGDTFVEREDGWYKEDNFDEVVLDGSESLIVATLTNYVRTRVAPNVEIHGVNDRSLSNTFIYKNDYSLDDSHYYFYNNYFYLFISIEDLGGTSADNVKAWLANTKPKFIHQKQTPTYTKLPDKLSQQLDTIANTLKTYSGTTHITVQSESGVGPIMNLTYYISNKARIKALEEAILNS